MLYTLAAEHGWLEDPFPFGKACFHGYVGVSVLILKVELLIERPVVKLSPGWVGSRHMFSRNEWQSGNSKIVCDLFRDG